MRKAFLAVLVIVLAVGLVAYGCGGGEETTTTPGGGQTTTATTQTTTTPTSPSQGGGITWNDVPVYPGAGSVQEASWSVPGAQGDYARVEWRYYTTGASLDEVADFYESEMPDNGWEEIANVNTPELKYYMYNKNGEDDAAMVWIASQDNETAFALMRAAK